MRKVKTYIASDGITFDTEQGCKEYEKLRGRIRQFIAANTDAKGPGRAEFYERLLIEWERTRCRLLKDARMPANPARAAVEQTHALVEEIMEDIAKKNW